ncbi:tyrosine--tRNA ligase 1 [Paenibacillus sp. CCS19]|uniref:tyrosine--tRNA ligase n=1 Tax=Paenibacillus sp. CCS19 TaxID=3158387 RepID=UPI00256B3C2B|nr:tyrosine--tRNA ligase [Paenibacillus cellulosilyticus]GMK42126.1 tyrosine--tRNA ligase 1 [Paenibacillus cellulosilyticus]
MTQPTVTGIAADFLEELEYRGLIHQTTNREALLEKMTNDRVVLYCGFDPTADSLHIGSLLPILMLRRFQQAGHNPIALVGGGTGLIGDPSGRSTERSLNSDDTVAQWTDSLKRQLSRFLDFNAQDNPAKLVSNYDWLAPLDIITFLRDIGKNFTVNYMLAKDSVDSRLANGISFTEFSYMILQAYDFYRLRTEHNCALQIGGSDQWGNITAGLDLIGKMGGGDAYGITMPLVTKSDGKKFGKSESGAVWLDSTKTSVYTFYQFWINTDDSDVIKFLKYFTFLDRAQIAALETELNERPEKRAAQRELAREVTRLVHGDAAVESAERITEALFSGDVTKLNEAELVEALAGMPTAEHAAGEEPLLIDLLIAAKAAPSKRQARQDIESGAVYVNGEKTTSIEAVVSASQRLHGQYVVLRRGKKNYYLVRFV